MGRLCEAGHIFNDSAGPLLPHMMVLLEILIKLEKMGFSRNKEEYFLVPGGREGELLLHLFTPKLMAARMSLMRALWELLGQCGSQPQSVLLSPQS